MQHAEAHFPEKEPAHYLAADIKVRPQVPILSAVCGSGDYTPSIVAGRCNVYASICERYCYMKLEIADAAWRILLLLLLL